LDALAYADRARTVRGEAVRWLRANAAEVASADVILLDPPYGDDVFMSSLTAIDELAGETTTIVAEHAAAAELPALRRLQVERSRRYGDTELTLLRAR
jgi:16S rRNA G966 N2-methylase RsmD